MSKQRKLTGLEVAVIGMSVRLPGAENKDEFWNNLKNGVESVQKFTDEELLKAGVSIEMINNPAYVKSGVDIKDKECFDSKFFDYRPDEAKLMNPQTRVFHQCVWEALEDSGYVPDRYDGIIGLYAGAKSDINWENYSLLFNSNTSVDEFSSRIYRKVDYFCSMIAYKLNLRGPAVFVNTACSTSLVAIHMATMSLLTGETNIALAGGITLSSTKSEGYLYKEGMINSPDGHCKPFDDSANGIVPGEGAGVVVLKKLDEALRDGDNIYAIIKGSAINNDGNRKVGYTAPAVKGQSNVIKSAQIMSRVKPETISYVEAHGTGTFLGDPVEIEGLSHAFGKSQNKYCKIGSVKSNIGHADSAAGVAGFIKTVMALKNEQIPPTLHFNKINSKISLKDTPFTINSELNEWKSESYPRRAGVSSFGIGGTNAHVILEEALEQEKNIAENKHQLLVFSAKSPNSLKNTVSKYIEYFRKNQDVNLADLAWTLQTGRSVFPYKFKMVAKNPQEALDILINKKLDQVEESKVEENKNSIAFILSGDGSINVDTAREIYEEEPLFKDKMNQCFSILKELTSMDFKEILYPEKGLVEDAQAKLNKPELGYAAKFTVEYALASLLDTWGIKSDYMIGNGISEYVLACLTGVLSLQDTLESVVLAGKMVATKDMNFEDYWSQHLAQPVKSYNSVESVLEKDKNCAFVELNISDMKLLLNQVGELWLKGININWEKVHLNEKRRKVSAPTYSFEKKAYPLALNMGQFLKANLSEMNLSELIQQEMMVTEQEIYKQEEEVAVGAITQDPLEVSVDETNDSLTDTEKILVELWRDFFDIEEVGIHDDFFEIGGDSLRAMGLAIELREQFGVEISIDQLFSLTTIEDLAKHIDFQNSDNAGVQEEEETIEGKDDSIERITI